MELNTETPRSHALDGLRGFAAAAVVVYHAILHNDLALMERVLYRPIQAVASVDDLLAKLMLLLQNGETAVYVFFVLSGAVLHLSLDRRAGVHPVRLVAAFVRNRLLRLYPPLIACLLLMFAMGLAGVPGIPHYEPGALFENATLLKISMHGPSDTIKAEVLAIPFILAAWLLRRALGLPGLMLAFLYSILALDNPNLVFSLPSMNLYLMAFMAGMLAAEPQLRALMRQAPPSSWLLALAVLILAHAFQPHGSLPALIAMVMAAGFLVSGLLYGQAGALARFLEGRLAQALGKVSFSLYLYNVPVLFVLWSWTGTLAWPKAHLVAAGLLVAAVSLLLTWPLAWASERWIERPFASFGRRKRAVPNPETDALARVA
ncbi:MAG: acyltransferase [Pseudomonadota bacterium]